MRRLSLLVLLLTVPFWVRFSLAACAGPYLESIDRVVERGEPIEVVGYGWATGCDDSPDQGCSGDAESEPSEPMHDISVRLKRDGVQLRSYLVDAADGTLRLEIPSESLKPGRYQVMASYGGWAEDGQFFEVVRARPFDF